MRFDFEKQRRHHADGFLARRVTATFALQQKAVQLLEAGDFAQLLSTDRHRPGHFVWKPHDRSRQQDLLAVDDESLAAVLLADAAENTLQFGGKRCWRESEYNEPNTKQTIKKKNKAEERRRVSSKQQRDARQLRRRRTNMRQAKRRWQRCFHDFFKRLPFRRRKELIALDQKLVILSKSATTNSEARKSRFETQNMYIQTNQRVFIEARKIAKIYHIRRNEHIANP